VAARTLAEVVPYITRWNSEHITKASVVQRSGGIAYADERPGDRDRYGVLWARVTSSPGQGRPQFGKVHARRQRHAMLRLLCQVCGRPADRNADGVLWLVGEDAADQASWPVPYQTPQPPVCTPCAARAAQMCPHLRLHHSALRVQDFQITGVHGALYYPSHPNPVQIGAAGLALDHTHIRWLRAGQLIVSLCKFTVTSLGKLTDR
jgi:hypothetical protein